MKTKLLISLGLAGMLLLALLLVPSWVTRADDAADLPAAIQAVESGQVDALYAEITQEGGEESGLSAVYEELKQLSRQYRRAHSEEEKHQALSRAEHLMGQLFDAKIQAEERRLEAQQKRLEAERRRVQDLRARKADLVRSGAQRALESGELPDWAGKEY